MEIRKLGSEEVRKKKRDSGHLATLLSKP